MKKSEITKLQKELDAVLSKYGMVTKNSARHNDTEVRISLAAALTPQGKSSNNTLPDSGKRPDNDILRNGWAGPGDRAVVQGREVVITSSKRVNYSFRFVDEPENSYVGKFRMFTQLQNVKA